LLLPLWSFQGAREHALAEIRKTVSQNSTAWSNSELDIVLGEFDFRTTGEPAIDGSNSLPE
jgi:hypothetical protein